MADDVDRTLAGMKRSAMAAEYHRRLVEVVPEFDPAGEPLERDLETTSMRLAVITAARHGFDAGRFAVDQPCPYPMGASVLDTLARRAWMLGYTRGRAVEPRPEPRPLRPARVTIR